MEGTFTDGDWDYDYVSRATVIREGATYHMWYSGGAGRMDEGIGSASSSDGVSWVKGPSNPLWHKDDTGEPWRDSRTYCPWVTFDSLSYSGHGDNCRFKMWAAGKEDSSGYYSIGYWGNSLTPIQVNINFQPPGSTVPEGYQKDNGPTYDVKPGGRSFGWRY